MSTDLLSVWILGDQLLRQHPALAAALQLAPRERIRVVLIESRRRAQRLPYHGKKLILLFSAMRHFAEWLRTQGFVVDYVQAESTLTGLREHLARHRATRLIVMEASEYRGRAWQRERLTDQAGVPVTLLPNTQFLIGQFNPYPEPQPGKRYVMEHFYREMRRHFDVLMAGDQPVGGEWNYDRLNRQRLPSRATPPLPLSFTPDSLTQEVIGAVEREGVFTGTTEDFALAVTHAQAKAALADFIAYRLEDFGPYEDAMSSQHLLLFHSGLSPYLNLGLLEPLPVIRAVEAAYAAGSVPIQSAEGFIRQVLGWREFMAWQYWRQMPAMLGANAWNATAPLPAFFWTGETELRCLRHVIQRALQHGYAHHIERLMLVCNFCLLAGVAPRVVNDWFLSAFIDAYEWVMLPNVLGMGLNADGGLTATKPYIASASYINRMSDYCAGCRFNPAARTGPQACPFNVLYWDFLLEHESVLRANPRFGPSVLGLRHLDDAERVGVRRQAARLREDLFGDATPDPLRR